MISFFLMKKKTPNKETVQAIKDVELGKTNKYDSSIELFEK